MEQGEPECKRFKHSIISEHMCQPAFQELFHKHWNRHTAVKTGDLEVIVEPFRICRISNFLKNEEFMDEIKNELLDVKSRRNSIDLYQFEQSNDLARVDSQNLKTLYETFQTDLVDWMERNTNIELNKKISMSSSCYSDTDYLLCHDDNLGDRRIAFILYLSKNWTQEDGGALDLFDSDENGLPRKVVKSLTPEYNSLVFFEVVDNSYHQVAEITSADKSRWSINGWFHGPLTRAKKPERPEPILRYVEPESTEIDLNLWISKVYLYPGIIKEIQEDVEQESFAFLSDFLKPDIYEKLSAEIQSENIKWKLAGPADIRKYEVAEEDSLSATLADFCKLFKSITIFQLLKNYTELDLVPEREMMNPKMAIELQRWSKGCYTLISDKQNYKDGTTTVTEKKFSATINKYDSDVIRGESSSSAQVLRLRNNYIEESHSSGKKINDSNGCNTPPSSQGDDDDEDEDDRTKHVVKTKSPRAKKRISSAYQQASPSKADITSSQRNMRNSDTDDDSDVSDIGDYLSDPLDCSFDCSDQDEPEDEAEKAEEPGSLDVIMQFHTSQVLDNETIDYVDPREEDGALIHVPSKDNHLCLVYKTLGTSRVHKYVNHYCKGYFYNLVCTYYE